MKTGPKKQLRCYDLYRCAIERKREAIEGIENYGCDSAVASINVMFSNGDMYIFAREDEDDLKDIIKRINKMKRLIALGDEEGARKVFVGVDE